MAVFWIDASMLVENSNTLHPNERIPQFWVFLESQIKKGNICIPKMVHGEVTKGNDWVANWCKHRNDGHFCVSPNREIQETHIPIVMEHLEKEYAGKRMRHQLDKFASGADPWLIAYARENSGVAVSEEDRAKKFDQKIKIPNVCKGVGVAWCDTYEMLKRLKAKF